MLLASVLTATSAAAATHFVDADGTYDAATQDCTGSDPALTTIQAAVTAAADNDSIEVCPGTYAESKITINKALSVQSVAGADVTIIDGGGGNGLALAGTVHITATTGDVLFDGFTLRNAKAQGTGQTRFNIRVGSTAPVTITVTNNVLIGTNTSNSGDFGLYAAGPDSMDSLVFQYNELREHGSNPILIERHEGPTDVSYNTFDRGVAAGATTGYVNMSHTNDPITTLQRVSHNTINLANDPGPYTAANASGAISFLGALTGTTLGSFSNVEITHNRIINLGSFRRGITLSNGANTLATQNLGVIANAVIRCNEMSGSGAADSMGIRLLGYSSNPTIENNTLNGVDIGIRAEPRNGHIVDTATVSENSFETGAFAIDWQATGALSAESNWWGSANGPTNAGNPGGDGGIINAAGPVDFVPWLASGVDSDASGPCFEPSAADDCKGIETCTAPGVCDAPDAPDGTTCDDGNACSTGDVCTAGVCSGPGNTCGDGVIDALCGETCDDGGNNGSNLCCSASCQVVDGDADEVCDRDDPCTNGAQATKQKLIGTKVAAPGGDDKVNLSGSAVIPTTPELDPSENGVRFLLTGATGATIVDTTIPGGDYDPLTRTGWRINRSGTAWTYIGPGTTTDGIQKVSVKLAPKSVEGGVKFKVKGKNGTYPVTATDVPVKGTLVLDPPAAVTGQCIEASFAASPPASPSCRLGKNGTVLKCK